MQRYIFFRVIQMLIALLIISMVIFGVVRIQGDPAMHFLPDDATQEDYMRIRERMGLNKPIIVQYGIFLLRAIKGDFGNSIYTQRPVLGLIAEALPNSLRLTIPALMISLILAIPLGVLAASRKGKPIDKTARVIAGLGQSVPSFWQALMAMQLFAVIFGILPTSGMGTWKHYILPVSCLAFFCMPGPIRLVRSSMLENFDSEFIKFARIKGLSQRMVIWKHALRNSLLPVLGFSSVQMASMITGAVVIETVFAWPGIGRLAFSSITSQDFPLIQAIVLFTAFLVILSNLATDIIYAFVDPRIRLKI